MKSLAEWLEDYGQDHRNSRNQKLHRICVPAIFLSVVVLVHLIPFSVGPVKIGDIALLIALAWYAFLGWRALLLMVAQLLISLGVATVLQNQLGTQPTMWTMIAIFVIAWIGQFYGHELEGRRPSFLTDLQYLLIGPLWIWLGEHSSS